MNKEERIKRNMREDVDIAKYMEKDSYPVDIDDLYLDIKTYIKATKEKRMVCVIDRVFSQGMDRDMMFYSCEKSKWGYNHRQYYSLFKAYGHEFKGRSRYATINGCGMDMVFNTNYNMIHWFRHLGFISRKQCNHLAQHTPNDL